MTTTARALLEEFDTLDPADRQEVAAEILRRTLGPGGLDDTAYADIGATLFQAYDEEERARAQA